MVYTTETTEKLKQDYLAGVPVATIAEELGVPARSVIAKLSCMGVYKRKEYLNKRGEVPTRKEEYLVRIAEHLDVQLDIIESLEKANKNVLILLDTRLSALLEK